MMREDIFHLCVQAGLVIKRFDGPPPRLATASGAPMPAIGTFLIRLSVQGLPYTGTFVVAPAMNSPIIIGMRAIKELGISYNAAADAFSFPDGVNGKEEVAEIRVVRQTTVQPGQAQLLHLRATLDDKPWADTELLAHVNNQDVLVRTDSNGRFALPLANYDTSTPAVWDRWRHAGFATKLQEAAVVAPVDTPQVEAIVASIRTPAPPEQAGRARPLPETLRRAAAPSPKDPTVHQQIEDAVKHLPPPEQQALRTVLRRHFQAISAHKYDLGYCDLWEHRINLCDRRPVFHKQFPIPLEHAPVIKEQVEQWLRLGVIEPAKSPFNSPIFCVKKKNEGGFRLCLDYRGVNANSLPENYCIRTAEDCMTEVGRNGGVEFIALDLRSGFYQMGLDKASRRVTAFTVPGFGQMQWTRAAMGLRGCPASFQRLMDLALKGIPNVITYIDDVLIYGRTKVDCINTLSLVMHRLQRHGLKIGLSKSSFLQKNTDYLGHILSRDGIAPGQEKRDAIKHAKLPNTRKQLKSFLGIVNYFRTYVEHFAHVAGKLHTRY